MTGLEAHPPVVAEALGGVDQSLPAAVFHYLQGKPFYYCEGLQRVFQLDAMERPHEYIYNDEAEFNLTKRRRRGRSVIGQQALLVSLGSVVAMSHCVLPSAIMGLSTIMPTWGPTTLTSSSFSSITCKMLC